MPSPIRTKGTADAPFLCPLYEKETAHRHFSYCFLMEMFDFYQKGNAKKRCDFAIFGIENCKIPSLKFLTHLRCYKKVFQTFLTRISIRYGKHASRFSDCALCAGLVAHYISGFFRIIVGHFLGFGFDDFYEIGG